MYYTKLTKETIETLWNNWVTYFNERVEAIQGVYDDACNSYREYADIYYNDSEEDFEYGERWLDEKYEQVHQWSLKMVENLKAETEKFKEFLIKLGQLKLYDSQVGMICNVHFYELYWDFQKNPDPSQAKQVFVHFETQHHWYEWDGKYRRTVVYKTCKPQFIGWQKE